VIAAVFDTSVLVAGCGWHGEGNRCLVAMAQRRARVFTSQYIIDELQEAIREFRQQRRITPRDMLPAFNWFCDKATVVTPSSLGKQRSRDPKDDPVLGTALAAGAGLLVSYDFHLLDLEKPFGIEIIRPREFLALL
jgi:putative PIN family toxin of toxin-antitoxin system